MDDILDLCWNVFPWISDQATCLGLETMDNRFAQLGGELFILAQQITFSGQTGINSKLVKVAKLVNKACSVPRTKHVRDNGSFDALRRILEYKDSNSPAQRILISDIRRSLLQFVQENPEYYSLLRFITDCLHATDSPDTPPDEQMYLYNMDTSYPAQVNNILYTQLRIHSTCSCSTQHLDFTRLRLDPEHDKQDGADIPFDLLFAAGPTSCLSTNYQVRWKEARILVAKPTEPQAKKQVSFAVQTSSPSPKASSKSPPSGIRKIELGEFCRLIGSEKDKPIHFHIQNNIMKLADAAQETLWRNFLPQAGVPLAEWLEQTVHLSNRAKVTLAYTIARSVWQYYNSYWMVKPWTHENILMVKEKINDGNLIRPHIYFTTKLHKCKGQILDHCVADDLFHMYPSILALGVVLIEIAAKQPFRPDGPHYLWDETTINDYYEWAWATANCGDFGNAIGTAYGAVVNNCLDAELFRSGPIDPSKLDKDLEIRRSVLYEKVVLPLRQLYHAYKDDWEIQEIPKSVIPVSSKIRQTEHASRSKPANRSQFTVAIFCALTLESDAVSGVFEEIWDQKGESYGPAVGDDNIYTLGKILDHNVVLVHMAGIGKGAASQAASRIRCSYPEINLALVVGICGGVPSFLEGKADLILGDIVISDGIVQYDFGRQFPDAFWSKAGPEVVARPGPKLRGILAKLKGVRGRERIESKLSQHLRVLQGELGPNRAGYPGTDKDELFPSTYRHKHQDPAACRLCSACEDGADPVCEEARGLTCEQLGCQKALLVQRKRPQEASTKGYTPSPKIHFGFVGSGDTVMKSGQHRDKTAAQHNLIAFEMEASGIWDNLPCLVIKGVCDYADSHKNKHWQHYAAATAAAGMKAVLEECMVG